MAGYELTVVTPDPAGEFLTTVTIPDWPEALYGMGARQPKSGADWCSGDVEIRIDREPDAATGECWISLAQTKVGIGFPWSPVYPVYVTYGGGFAPGEVVVITVEDGYPFVAETVQKGDFTVVGPDGSFVMFDAPPTEWIPDLGMVEVWARSNSCIAKAALGEPGPVRAELPSFSVTPEVLKGGGIHLYPGDCDLVVWKETGVAVAGVDPSYQSYPLDENFINAFGTGFTAGEHVTWLLNGQVITYGSYSTVVDGAGKFYASGGNVLNPLQTADLPFILTASTPSCTTSAQYGALPVGNAPPVLPGSSSGLGPATLFGRGTCTLAVWKGNGQEYPGVPADYQDPALDQGHFTAYGTGFSPGTHVTIYVDDGFPVVGDGHPAVDVHGSFYASIATTGGLMVYLDSLQPPFVVTAVDYYGPCRASALYGPFPQAGAPVIEGIPTVPNLGPDPGPLADESTPVSLPPLSPPVVPQRAPGPLGFPPLSPPLSPPVLPPDPHTDCAVSVFRLWDKENPTDSLPSGVPLSAWDEYNTPSNYLGKEGNMFVWGESFTPDELGTARVNGRPVGLYPGDGISSAFYRPVSGDGSFGLYWIRDDYWDINGDHHAGPWSATDNICLFPCAFTLTVETQSCTASANFQEVDLGVFDGSDLVLDTIPIPGPPDGSEVINPSDGLFPEDLSPAGVAVLALVGLGFGVAGFVGGGAMAARGMLSNGSHQAPPDDGHPPEPGHSY
jgi:hypothetical protein